MSKHLSLLMLLMTLFVPWTANAQQTVTIGDGTTGKVTHPFHMAYNYSLSQQIYTANEIGMAGTINSIAFYHASTGSLVMEDVQVYLMHVNKSAFESRTDIVPLTDATKVYEGTFSANGTGWATLQFDTPFQYNGESNLLVCCFDPNVSKPGSSYKFNATNTTEYTTIVYFDNTRIPDVDNLSSYNGSSAYYKNHNNIQLVIVPDNCQKPSAIEVDGTTLTWADGSGTYNVEYKKASENNWTRAFTNLAATTCTLTMLDPITNYEARVQSVCDGNETSAWTSVSFTTACTAINSFPIYYGFETSEGFPSNDQYATANSLGSCWRNEATVQTGTNPTRVWGTSTSYKHGGSQALVLPDKGNSTNFAKTMLVFPEMNFTSENGYMVSFWIYRNNSASTPEGFKVYISDTDTISANAVELGHYSRNYNQPYPVVESASGWYKYEIEILPETMTGNAFLIFEGQSYYGNATYVDDITIREAINVTATHIVNNVTNPSTQMTWAQFAEYVSEGVSFQGVTITLDEDVTITNTVGSENEPFSGTFDGNNKTINANITSDEKAAAPFSYINNATIRNLTVTGSITCTDYHAGGLVGYAFSGTNTIENCLVSTTIHAKTYGGGIVGHAKAATLNMTGCVFNGTIDNTNAGTATDNNRGVGGLVGWCDNNARLNITNCLYDGTYGGNGSSVFFHPVACKTGGASITATINNCYYTCDQEQADSDGNSNVVTTAGRKAYSVTAISPVTMTNNVAGTVYDVSGITGYGTSWGGILYEGILYGGQGKTLSLNLQGSPTGLYQTDYGTITGSANPFSLNMAANNTEISALTCVAPTGLAISNVGAHNATASWTKAATQETGAVTFEYVCVAHGTAPNWANATTIIDNADNTNAPTATLSGLVAETQYDFYVRRNCGEGDYSREVMATFTTTIACPAPTNLTVSNITGHTATASWTGTNDNYNVYLGNLGPNANLLNVNFANGIPNNWSNTSSYPWTVTDGYIKSNNAGVASSTSSISVTVTFPANGTVEFDADCMGEGTGTYFDHCDFTIDGTRLLYVGANNPGWQHHTFDVTAGQHTFTWSYTKDGSVNPTGDYFAIDNVVMIASSIVWGEPITVEGNEYTFNGLDAETKYFVKVQSNCGDEGLSSELGPVNFTTDISCPAPTGLNVPDSTLTANSAVLHWNGDAESYNVSYYKTYFFEDFEEDLSQWTIYKEGDDGSWEWGIENPHDNSADLNAHGGFYAAVAYSDYDIHADSWLVSPQIQFPTQTTLKFWIMRSTYDDAKDEYEVRLSTTGNAISDFTTVLKEKAAANSTWTEVSIDLSAYDGQQCYIAIRHDFTNGFFIMVDDFGIFGWSEDIATTENSLLLEDLLPNTYYEWKVQANCGDVDGLSQWSSISNFTTLIPCPTPFDMTATNPTAHGATLSWYGLSDSYNVWVGELEMNTTAYDFEDNSISSDFTNSTTSPWTVTPNDKHAGTYSVMSGGAGVGSVTSDLKLEVTIEHEATLSFWARISSEASYDKGYFSINGINQSNLNGISGNGSWIHYSYPLAVGTHTLRWYYTKDSSVNSNDDCFYVDDITIGSEVVSSEMTYTATDSPFILDDATNIHPETTYLVKVKGICGDEETEFSETASFTTTVTCLPIDSLSFSNLSTTSVNLNWVLVDTTQTAWQVCLNDDEDNLIVANTNEDFLLEGLTPETEYTVKVRAFCDENDQSRWSNTITFTTLISCHAVSSLSYSNLAPTSVNLSWVLEDETQTAWQVCLNNDEDNLIVADTNEGFLLEGLASNVEYTVKVRAFCGENDFGRWSNTVTFTTPEICPTPTDFDVANLTAVSADLSWNGREDVESYTVRYRSAGGLVTLFKEDFSDNIDSWTMTGCSPRTGVVSGFFAFYQSTGEDPRQYLISPELTNLTSNSVIEFQYRIYSSSMVKTFQVGFSSTTNDVDSFSWSDVVTANNTTMLTYHANVPEGTKYIAIVCTSSNQSYLYFDNITVGYETIAGQWMTETTTATEAQLIDLIGGTQYEAQVRSDCNPEGWCDTITFETELDGTKVFVAEGDWNTASNWMPEGMPVLGNKVILRANATVPSGCVAEANRILFEGTTTLTIENGGQLKTNSDVTATVKKDIEGYGDNNTESSNGFCLIAVPTTTAITTADAGLITAQSNYDLYSWNRTATDEEWHYSHAGVSMANGQSYLYANLNDVEMSFTATLQRSGKPITMTPAYDDEFGGWNLYGNPFPCEVYLSSDEDVTFYRLVGNEFVPVTGAIAPMEGFFVKATAAGQTFTISREAPAEGGQPNE